MQRVCIHCSAGDRRSEDRFSHIRTKEASAALKWLAEHFPVTSVMAFGGEPLLYPEVVCAVFQQAAECGVPTRQLISNGVFVDPASCNSVCDLCHKIKQKRSDCHQET